jgi:hypothetical protein
VGAEAAAALAEALELCPRLTTCRVGAHGLPAPLFKAAFRDGAKKKKKGRKGKKKK